jgi:hypothetical protein
VLEALVQLLKNVEEDPVFDRGT